jgi:hypothetical protein
MIDWAYFPRNAPPGTFTRSIVECFESVSAKIDSVANNSQISAMYTDAQSDKVLAAVRPGLEALGFAVERGKTSAGKISVPVLFGPRGKPQRSFNADAYCAQEKYVVEVEAGRAVVNYQFLKDLFQACVMSEVEYLGLAVRNLYKTSKDFDRVYDFLDIIYTSGRMQLPLRGILLIGY